MKKTLLILLTIILYSVSAVHAQDNLKTGKTGTVLNETDSTSVQKDVNINFEDDGMGQSFTWQVFDNGEDTTLTVVDNPDKSGVNTSDKVLAFTMSADGQRWAGAFTEDIDAFIPDRDEETNALLVSVMVWKKNISNIEFKFETNHPVKPAIQVKANTITEEWEEMSFVLGSPVMHPTELLTRLVIIPDFIAEGTREENTVYIDNITYSSYTPDYTVEEVELPSTSAPVPQLTEEPLSIFSDVYGNISGGNFNPGWQQATQASIQAIGEDSMLVYHTLNHQGLETGQMLDVSDYEYLHLQMYTENASAVNVSLISGAAEKGYSLSITQGEWVSYHIPISHFADRVVLTDFRHIKFDDAGAGDFPTIFVDNILFTKEMVTSNEREMNNPARFTLSQNYPNPFNPTTNISYTLPTRSAVTMDVFTIQGQKVATLVQGEKAAGSHSLTFNGSNLSSGVYFYRLVADGFVQTRKMILIK